MSRGAKLFWAIALAFGAAIAIGLFSGCANQDPGALPVWPSDPVSAAPDTNSVNALIVATDLAVGIVITFSQDMSHELQAALEAAHMRVVSPRLVIVDTVDGTEWQREWIAAALAAGGEASPYLKPSALRPPSSALRPPSPVHPSGGWR